MIGLLILALFVFALTCWAVGYRTGLADGEQRGVPPMPTNSGWWCAHCGEHVPDHHVTYDELHDPVNGGCGHPLS